MDDVYIILIQWVVHPPVALAAGDPWTRSPPTSLNHHTWWYREASLLSTGLIDETPSISGDAG